MRVLLIGAYGFIGSEIARELARRGHDVTGLGRNTNHGRRILPQLRWIPADLSKMTSAEAWRPLLGAVDAVINASGLLQNGDGGTVEAVQLHAVVALMEACQTTGIGRLVQISATGAVPDASSDFMSTKARADAGIQSSAVPSLILRPGLVIGRDSYGGTELIRMAAAIPLKLKLPFSAAIQCTSIQDVAGAVADAMDCAEMRGGCFDLVERQQRSLEQIIESHRRWLGFPDARLSMPVPLWLFQVTSLTADVLGRFGWRSPLRRNALLALEIGVRGDVDESVRLLGREPLSLEDALSAHPAGKQDRLAARISLMLPLLLVSLFVMWFASGFATLMQVDRAAAIVEQSGMGGPSARAIAIAGGWLDVMLALALLWRRAVRPALLAMVLLTVFAYLIGGSVLLPSLWMDPLAPFAKALPATVLALIGYWAVEKR